MQKPPGNREKKGVCREYGVSRVGGWVVVVVVAMMVTTTMVMAMSILFGRRMCGTRHVRHGLESRASPLLEGYTLPIYHPFALAGGGGSSRKRLSRRMVGGGQGSSDHEGRRPGARILVGERP